MAVFITGGQAAERVNYVGWLQSSGTQHIDTLFKPTNNTRVVMCVSDVTSTDAFFFGAKNADSATAPLQFDLYRRSSNIRADYFGANSVLAVGANTTKTTIDFNKNSCSAYGVTATVTAAGSGTVPYNLLLLKCSLNGSPYSGVAGLVCKLYFCQIYDNGVLVRDLWPCYDPDGEACLYDKVSKAYFYNVGSGEFTADGSGGTTTEISFTINGTVYTAASGMTWREFVNSSYNSGSFRADTSGVRIGSSLVRDSSGNAVLTDAAIISGHAYKTL